jgi:hypothetical protein
MILHSKKIRRTISFGFRRDCVETRYTTYYEVFISHVKLLIVTCINTSKVIYMHSASIDGSHMVIVEASQ